MYAPADRFEATLKATDVDCFRRSLARADQFSLALFRQKVTAEPGAGLRSKIAQQLATLMPLEILGMHAANHWLGTTTRGCLVVVASINAGMRARINGWTEIFGSIGRWEDLALYSTRRVLLWTCTHEKEAVAYGPSSELRSFNLDPLPARPLQFVAEPLDAHAQEEIVRLAKAV
jgi:hypothetical protein